MTSDAPIYLDNNATTMIDPTVRDAMLPFLETHYANPSSPYTFARRASQALTKAREQLAECLGVQPDEVIFVSSATEANNTALRSALQTDPKRREIVTLQTEHSSVLNTCRHLSAAGYEVTYLPPGEQGTIDLAALEKAVTRKTAVVSAMMANNETGVITPIAEVARMAHEQGALLHTDAAQAFGKIPVNAATIGADYMALASHKLHGPKGIGALVCRRGRPYSPLIFGGEQEQGRRAGTENMPGVVGLGAAAELALLHLDTMRTTVRALRDRLEHELARRFLDMKIPGADTLRLPNTSSLLFKGLASDAILAQLDMAGMCCSSGSACASGSSEPSHVLEAMGFPRKWADGAVRVSLSRFNTDAEMDYVIEQFSGIVEKLSRPGPQVGTMESGSGA